MTRGIYITGTDTGAGKTFASACLLHALRAQGLSAVGMKPVASGCAMTDEGWRNEDALALQAASSPRPDYALVNPFALPEPTAPEIAAARAGVALSLPPILAAYAQLAARADVVVVEGVGGWLAPLTATLDQSDLVRALDLPVILVVGLRLGCINHARLTARAIAAEGFAFAGWIGSAVDPALAFPDETFAALERVLPGPCLGRLPFAPGMDAAALAGHIVPGDWRCA
ncbi:MAG: dethiobiotin synthase [Rehaibacterium terrae]|uniref:dethiobiotin synthase n=1 Tax=Rehaibacterium terrae TaxID=1341696 RepID=UPI00391D8034